MDLNAAQNQFQQLVSSVASDDLAQFFGWIQRTYLVSGLKVSAVNCSLIEKMTECLGERPAIAYSTLNSISNDIKSLVPKTGLLSSETINYPQVGQNSDCTPDNTVSVDAFLYDNMDIEELIKNGDLAQNYCLDCNSRNTKPLEFISHSASKLRISFIFTGFLKDFDFTNKTVLDVGSRFGAILYGVKCGDVLDFPQLISSSDLIILNNVFEFFADPSKQVECWRFLHQNVKSGTCLVTVPSLQHSLESLPNNEIDLSKWVLREEVREPLLAMSMEDMEEISEICVYRVI